MFQTSHPVTGIGFHDRTSEMERLAAFVAELRAGANRWLAVIGPRKVGKTSMILELSRRITDVHFIVSSSPRPGGNRSEGLLRTGMAGPRLDNEAHPICGRVTAPLSVAPRLVASLISR